MTDYPEALTTVIGDKRHPYQVVRRDLPTGRIMKRSGVPTQVDQRWWHLLRAAVPSCALALA